VQIAQTDKQREKDVKIRYIHKQANSERKRSAKKTNWKTKQLQIRQTVKQRYKNGE
jgi:hypothetical protein